MRYFAIRFIPAELGLSFVLGRAYSCLSQGHVMNWKNQLLKTPFLIVCIASAAAFAEESTFVTSDDVSAVQDDANFTTMDGRFIRYENVEDLSSTNEAGLLSSCKYLYTECSNNACSTGGAGAEGYHVYRCTSANGSVYFQYPRTCCGG